MLDSQLDQVQGPCTWVLHLSYEQQSVLQCISRAAMTLPCLPLHTLHTREPWKPPESAEPQNLPAGKPPKSVELTCRQASSAWVLMLRARCRAAWSISGLCILPAGGRSCFQSAAIGLEQPQHVQPGCRQQRLVWHELQHEPRCDADLESDV